MPTVLYKDEFNRFEISSAVPGDGIGISEVQKTSWLATYANKKIGLTREDIEATPFNSEENLLRWEEAIRPSEEKKIWVARINEKIIGYVVAVKGLEMNELSAIYVLPEYHGKDVSKSLILKALEWLGTQKNICVWVFPGNTRAVAFYKKFGFRESGRTSTIAINNKKIPCIEMIRRYNDPTS